MFNCASLGCLKKATNRCSTCLRESYCSSDCQKVDWKLHKLVCKNLKKLSNQFQPYHEVIRVIKDIKGETTKKKEVENRLLLHLISYAEYQFGDPVAGKFYRERGIGEERIDNWDVDIEILIVLYYDFIRSSENDKSVSLIVKDKTILPYYEKMLSILRPWSAYLDLNSTSRVVKLHKDQIDDIVFVFSNAHVAIASIHAQVSEFDLAEYHCQQALKYSELYDGEEEKKVALIYDALKVSCGIQDVQGNYDVAYTSAHEAYNIVAVAYNPVHPEVQDAASALIQCLIHQGDFDKAEVFAQMTLDSLKDRANGLDQESEVVAEGYYNFAKVLSRLNADLVKAEMLIRESLRIRVLLYDQNHYLVGRSCDVLSGVLVLQKKLGYETKEFLDRSLAIGIRNYGSEGNSTGVAYSNLGEYYRLLAEVSKIPESTSYFRLSKSNYEEAVRIFTNSVGHNHKMTTDCMPKLIYVLRKLSEA
jgi:hypothetical protein